MELKQRIVNEAQNLLTHMGPSAMTMDLVAKSCGISKRTLYEQFPDKKSLVYDCITQHHNKMDKEFRQIFENAENCFDALFKIYSKLQKYISTYALYRNEVRRVYPDIAKEFHANESQLVEQMSKVLEASVEQGLVLKFVNPRLAAFLFVAQMKNIHNDVKIAAYGFEKKDVFGASFFNFLRGVATQRGLEIIERYKDKNKID